MKIDCNKRILFTFDYLCNFYLDPVNTWNNRHIDRETGLSKAEKIVLGRYIKEQLPRWQERLDKEKTTFSFRVDRDESAVPRTLHVLRDHTGQLRVMVLCKTKRIPAVGFGGFKKVTKAVDWLTKEIWCFANTRERIHQVIHEVEMETIARSHPLGRNIKVPSCGLIRYENKGSAKLGFFSQLREGNLVNLVEKLDDSEKMKVMRSCMEILLLLEQKQIEHRDIKLQNFLFWRENGELRIELIDFGIARQEKTDDPSSKYYIDGTPLLFSPELKRAQLAANFLNDTNTLHRIRDNSWTKGDIWMMGLVLYAVLQGKKSACEAGYPIAQEIARFSIENLSEISTVLKDDDLFMKEIYGNQSAVFDEPPKETPLHLVWQMLQIDYRMRPSATDLYEQFNRLFPESTQQHQVPSVDGNILTTENTESPEPVLI